MVFKVAEDGGVATALLVTAETGLFLLLACPGSLGKLLQCAKILVCLLRTV